MKHKKIIQLYLGMIMMGISILACDDMGDNYEKFIENGPATYVGKVDSIQALSGNKRLQLSWSLSADPSVKTVKVYWNYQTDSLEVPVENLSTSKKMSVIVDNLTEGKYSFEIITYDSRNHRSKKVEAMGEVFGDNYTSTLINRPIASITTQPNGASITWGNFTGIPPEGLLVGSEVIYTDKEEKTQKIIVPETEGVTVLPNIKFESQVQYRAMYLPVSSAIDTFYSAIDFKDVPKYEQPYVALDKSKFVKVILPTDNTTTYGAIYPMENLWDNTTSNFYYTGRDSGIPSSFTFDLGKTVQLRKFLYQQRNTASVLWAGQNARKFEIWGMASTPTDGSWTGWTKLLDVDSPGRPSGGATNNEDDLAAAAIGDTYFFTSPTTPSVRYLRIKVTGTWANTQYFHIGEFTFWE